MTGRAAPRPVRVLLACDHIDFNGALHGGGRQLIELTRALLAMPEIEPTVCVLRPASPLGRQLQAEGLPFRFLGDGRFSPASLWKLLRIIRGQGIQVAHFTDFGACTFGRMAAAIAGVPSIVQIISGHSRFTKRGFPRHVELAYRLLAPFTARALAISEAARRFAIGRMGFAKDQVEVLHYPLPRHSFGEPSPEAVATLRSRLRIPPGAPVVGAVTRLFPVKGIGYLVDAFAAVRAAVPDAWLVLVGRGPEEQRLRARCRELGIDDRVRFAGFQRQTEAAYRLFDVSVTPSLEEAFGLVAVEAMALGVPVVASRVDGLTEVVRDGETGLLVDPANSDALAGAIVRLLSDPELRRRLGERGPVVARRFGLDRYVARLTALYAQLASRAAHPVPEFHEAGSPA